MCYRVGVGVGAGDVEVDVLYITFLISVQYTGLLGTVHARYNKASEVPCTGT